MQSDFNRFAILWMMVVVTLAAPAWAQSPIAADPYLRFDVDGMLQMTGALSKLPEEEQVRTLTAIFCDGVLQDAKAFTMAAVAEVVPASRSSLYEAALQNYLYCGDIDGAQHVDRELQRTYGQMDSWYVIAYEARRMLMGFDRHGSLIKARARLSFVVSGIDGSPAHQALKDQCDALLDYFTPERARQNLSKQLLHFGLFLTQLEFSEPENFWRNKEYEQWKLTSRTALFLQLVAYLERGEANSIAKALQLLHKRQPREGRTTPDDNSNPGIRYADRFQRVWVDESGTNRKLVLRGGEISLPHDGSEYTVDITITSAGGDLLIRKHPHAVEALGAHALDTLGYEVPAKIFRFSGDKTGVLHVIDGKIDEKKLVAIPDDEPIGKMALAMQPTPQREAWVAYEERRLLERFVREGKTGQALFDALLLLEQQDEEDVEGQEQTILSLAKAYRKGSKYEVATKVLEDINHHSVYQERQAILADMNGRFGDRFQDQLAEFFVIDVPITVASIIFAEGAVGAAVVRGSTMAGQGLVSAAVRNASIFLGKRGAAAWLARRALVGVPFTLASRNLERLAGRSITTSFYTDYLMKTSVLIALGGVATFVKFGAMAPLARRFPILRDAQELGVPFTRANGTETYFPKLSFAGTALHESAQIVAPATALTGMQMGVTYFNELGDADKSVLERLPHKTTDWLELLTRNLMFSAAIRLGGKPFERAEWEQVIGGQTYSQVFAELRRPGIADPIVARARRMPTNSWSSADDMPLGGGGSAPRPTAPRVPGGRGGKGTALLDPPTTVQSPTVLQLPAPQAATTGPRASATLIEPPQTAAKNFWIGLITPTTLGDTTDGAIPESEDTRRRKRAEYDDLVANGALDPLNISFETFLTGGFTPELGQTAPQDGEDQDRVESEEEYELARLGIYFRRQKLADAPFTLAYLTAGTDWDGSITGKEAGLLAARLFFISKGSDLPAIRKYLADNISTSGSASDAIAKIRQVENLPPFLLAKLRGKVMFEITALFPPVVLLHLGRDGSISRGTTFGENCFGAAEAFHTGKGGTYLDTEPFETFVSQLQVVPSSEAPKFGDLLFLPESEHAAIYLFGDLLFQKPSMGVAHAYEIVPYGHMFDTMNRAIKAYSSGAPSGGAGTPWDIFVSGLQGRTPLDAPPSITDGDRVLRYRSAISPAAR